MEVAKVSPEAEDVTVRQRGVFHDDLRIGGVDVDAGGQKGPKRR